MKTSDQPQPNTLQAAEHPGHYLRRTVLEPQRLTVAEAAKLLNLSRPHLSNFINGKVSATANLAARLEKTFGIPVKDILDLQASFDAQKSAPRAMAAEKAHPYVVPILASRAIDLASWAETSESRNRFAVLLRTLVHSTGDTLKKVVFHGNDNAQRPGWDGVIDCERGNAWIPSGESCWEFGVTKDSKSKATMDYDKRTLLIPAEERKKMTFIFVTPRNWPAKDSWQEEKRKAKQWRDVRVYDASDLEQWLEQSPAGQIWFDEEYTHLLPGVRTLDACWSRWANATTPTFAPELFEPHITRWRTAFEAFLASPLPATLSLSSDSTAEALAFLSLLLKEPAHESWRHRTLVFDDLKKLPRISNIGVEYLVIVTAKATECENLALIAARHRLIMLYPRNTIPSGRIDTHTIALTPSPTRGLAETLVNSMNLTQDTARRLAKASGGSLTVLRRLLWPKTVPNIPKWAENESRVRTLIPFALLGGWNTRCPDDMKAVLQLSGKDCNYTNDDFNALLELEDPPVWKFGDNQGVVSKVDALFTVAQKVTESDLRQFYSLTMTVLDDEPLAPNAKDDLPSVFGSQRYSDSLKKNLADTAVLLSLHGDRFSRCSAFDCCRENSVLLSSLLSPLTREKLERHQQYLPLLAEAAPAEFLCLVKKALKQGAAHELLQAAPGTFMPTYPRVGLLSALETLAWNPDYFQVVIGILGKLSDAEPRDRCGNTPVDSLRKILAVWMPQTAAPFEMQKTAIEELLKNHPAVGWTICVGQIPSGEKLIGQYARKPEWREDALDQGEPIRSSERLNRYWTELVDLALNQPKYSAQTLCDLVQKLPWLPQDRREEIWRKIETWLSSNADDDDKVSLRNTIRWTVIAAKKRARLNQSDVPAWILKAEELYAQLLPQDKAKQFEWLFKNLLVEGMDLDPPEQNLHQDRLKSLEGPRIKALAEIVREKGLPGLFELAEKGSTQRLIGALSAGHVLTEAQLENLVNLFLKQSPRTKQSEDVMRGALGAISAAKLSSLFRHLQQALSLEDLLVILLLAPYRRSTWELTERLPDDQRKEYWRRVTPGYLGDSIADNEEGIQRLLNAERPKAAFWTARLFLDRINIALLVQILQKMACSNEDSRYQPEGYCVVKALQRIGRDQDISLETKAKLELSYLNVLEIEKCHGTLGVISNLERYVEQHPEFFVQMVAWAFQREDHGIDPETVKPAGDAGRAAELAHKFLMLKEHIPGADAPNEGQRRSMLRSWIASVREQGASLGRNKSTDYEIGELLAHSKEGKDGIWPDEVVRDVLEEAQSDAMFEGAYIETCNARGVHTKTGNGDQERVIAARYRRWAAALRESHFLVSVQLLEALARSYEEEGKREDAEGMRIRLNYR